MAVSHIMLESYKKYILVSLILLGKVQQLPKYTSQIVGRFIKVSVQGERLSSRLSQGGSQARGGVGAAAAGLHPSHSSAGSEPHLRPTTQLTATPDP